MDKEVLLLEQWKAASELQRHADDMAWRTLNYFVATNGLLASALVGVVVALTTSDVPSSNACAQSWHDLARSMVTVVIPLLGAVSSFVWWAAQGRLQGYHRYRSEQASQTEDTLRQTRGERTLDLYEVGLDKQKLVQVHWYNRIPAHDLVVWLAFSLMILWIVAIPVLCLFLFPDLFAMTISIWKNR